MKEYRSKSAAETAAIAEELGRGAAPGTLLALKGDLGAGKTVFAQGVARGLGIGEAVDSPTFTILKIYEGGRLPLYHFDVYRLEDADEMAELGLDEYLDGDGLCLIEWAELVRDILPPGTKYITIEREEDGDFDHRRIRIEE